MKDPLAVATSAVGAALFLVVARYVVTGDINEQIFSTLGTIFGGLFTALSTRKGGKDDDSD